MLTSKKQLMRGNSVCLTTAYLAPVSYYSALVKAESVFIEQYDYYVKQTYRNRCHIASANGLMSLTIPIEKQGKDKILTRDIRISDHNDWQVQHWRSIESAYRSSPFFEYYKDDFFPFYTKKWEFLWDFNEQIQQLVFELLDVNPTLNKTKEYSVSLPEEMMDLREQIHPKKQDHVVDLKPYYQVFEQKLGFIPDLSIIDLLFNMGNEAQLII